MNELTKLTGEEITEKRYQKFRKMGEYKDICC